MIKMIKRHIDIFLKSLLPAMTLISCVETVDMGKDEGIVHEYPVSLSVRQPYEETRISVNGTSVAWEEDDRLQVTAADVDGNTGTSALTWFSRVDGKDGHFASFSGFVTMNSMPADCYFIYPYKSVTSVDGKTGKITLYYNNQTGLHEPFMYSKTAYDENGISTKLNHVGAMLEIQVNIDGVSQLTFAGNRLEGLSPVIVDAATGEVSFTNEANVQITVPVQSEGKTYIAVPPVNLEKGFSIICSNADASKSMIRSFSSDGNFSSGYDFSSKVGQIIPITLSGNLESYSVTSSDPVVAHTKNASGLLTGTSVSFSMNKTGASDKIIEEWGATLVNADGTVVREAKYTNATPVDGSTVTMSISNNWKLLPAGTYTFTPYYMIYGQKISMDSYVKTVTVSDPGVSLVIGGQTSYDKYKAGNVSGANTHANTLIEGVNVSTNVDLSIIDSYSASLDGADLGNASVTSGTSVVASYGNLTRTQYKTYLCKAEMTVGPVTFTSERDFHITGLPYEADFTSSNPTGWSPAWAFVGGNLKYSDKRVNYTNSATSELQAGVRSPQFYTPTSIIVKTAFDACGRNVDFSLFGAVIDKAAYLDIYYVACAPNESSVIFGSNCVRAHYDVAYSQNGYLAWSSNLTLSSSTPSIMYSAKSKLYDKALYKVKIHYSN